MNVAAEQSFTAPIALKGKAEPANLDIEIAILGGILADPLAYDRVSDIAAARQFYLKHHQQVFAAFAALREAQRPIDAMTTIAQLTDMGVDQAQTIVLDLMDYSPSAVNIDHYAATLRSKWEIRETIRITREATQMAYGDGMTPEALRIYIQDQLTALAGDPRGGVTTIGDAVGQRLEEISVRTETGVTGYVPTGIASLDDLLMGGIRPGKLIVIAGRPGMGKSALGVSNLLPAIAAHSGKASIVFSLEMDRSELVDRFFASELSQPWTLQDRNLPQLNWDELGQVASKLSGLPIFIDDRPGATFEQICSACRRLKAEQGEIGCIAIDYLQIMGGLDNDSNMTLSLAKIANGFKNLARELDTTIFLLSQLNRGVEGRQDKRPTSADLRQSGAIEEAADIVVMLYRDEIYNPETDDKGVAELILTKHRGGQTGTVKTVFDGMRSKFWAIDASPVRSESQEDYNDF